MNKTDLFGGLSAADIDKIRASVIDAQPIKAVAKVVDDSIEMTMSGFVGDPGVGMDSESVNTFLREYPDIPIKAYLNSPGGFVMDGLAIYNAIKMHNAPTHAIVEANAGSSMSIIAEAFDVVEMHEASSFMIHRAWGMMVGNRDDMLDMADRLKTIDEMLFGIYKSRTGADDEELSAWMAGRVDGTTFSAAEAVKYGFADAVIPNKQRADEQLQRSDTFGHIQAMAVQLLRDRLADR